MSQSSSHPIISHVSDTAHWVTTYRAEETKRSDALFRDPLSEQLVGEKARRISETIDFSRYASWSVVIRTCMIDSFIQELVAQGVDTILNLGAGLDTRPYRLKLPKKLNWIEIDYPSMIEFKESRLSKEQPHCQLERIKLDLANRSERQKTFARINTHAKKVLVLTEGVVPYLTNDQVATLAKDLLAQPKFALWIVDYFSPFWMKYFQSKKLREQMKNAPFVFLPKNWYRFFQENGWRKKEERFLFDASEQLGRKVPMPRIIERLKILRRVPGPFRKLLGYVVLEPNS